MGAAAGASELEPFMSTSENHIHNAALPLRGAEDLDPLLEKIGAARVVLVGGATHGTAQFFQWRVELTRRLVAEHGFSFIAVEGEWLECLDVHRSVVGALATDADPRKALLRVSHWPSWMWANEEVAAFLGWLRTYNEARPSRLRVGFHGLDVYSLQASVHAVFDYLARHEPRHPSIARKALRCFAPYGEEPEQHAWATRLVPANRTEEVTSLLEELRASGLTATPSAGALDERFGAMQNAAVTAGAERYYRALLGGDAASWNARDHHMADTLDRLLDQYGAESKAVVWAHNTHVGDANATDMIAAGRTNLGRIARQRYSQDGVVLIGFSTHRGTVIASDHWGGPARCASVPEARAGTLDALLHDGISGSDALLVFPPPDAQPSWLRSALPQRTIGVVYDPENEIHNYLPSITGRRFDALLHIDQSSALHPLHLHEPRSRGPDPHRAA
jgi:erythromycin esterase-like protein